MINTGTGLTAMLFALFPIFFESKKYSTLTLKKKGHVAGNLRILPIKKKQPLLKRLSLNMNSCNDLISVWHAWQDSNLRPTD